MGWTDQFDPQNDKFGDFLYIFISRYALSPTQPFFKTKTGILIGAKSPESRAPWSKTSSFGSIRSKCPINYETGWGFLFSVGY